MRTLRNCKLEDIKIGEVFAIEGCWNILEKRRDNEYMGISDSWSFDKQYNIAGLKIKIKEWMQSYGNDKVYVLLAPNEETIINFTSKDVYKLSKVDQHKWKTGE